VEVKKRKKKNSIQLEKGVFLNCRRWGNGRKKRGKNSPFSMREVPIKKEGRKRSKNYKPWKRGIISFGEREKLSLKLKFSGRHSDKRGEKKKRKMRKEK